MLRRRTAADYGPGSAQNTVEVTGFSWKRKEFDHEWDNEAEIPIAELDFEEGDTEETKKHKIELLHIYNKRIQERERRRAIILQV